MDELNNKNNNVNDNKVNDGECVIVDLDQYSERDWDLLVNSGANVSSNNDKDLLKFIPRNDDGKRFHILATIEIMRKVVESDSELNDLFKKLRDSVCHTAPEILHLRWKDIYRFCLRYFSDLDDERGWSRQILRIYNSRIQQYCAVFK